MKNLGALLRLSAVRRFAKGAVIAREGAATAGEMLIFLQGEVGVYRKYETSERQLARTLGPGGFVGEESLFSGLPPKETAVAESDVIAAAVNRQNAEEFFATSPDLTFSIIEGIVGKKEALQKEYDELLADVRSGTAAKKLREAQSKASRSSALFPEGHGNYQLPIDNSLSEYLYADSVTCPVCGHTFTSLAVISSRLRRESSEEELRSRYKDIEPMYYEITTCPKCLLSTPSEEFAKVSKRLASRLDDELARFRPETAVREGYERDTFTVFAGYYLAISCAPLCFDDHQLIQGSLWQKLSRLYGDLGDQAMCEYSTKECLSCYLYSYENFNLNEKKVQQVSFIIGDLYQRVGDLDKARTFYFMAKTNKAGSNLIKRQADIRLDQIRELIQQGKGSQG
ncbi:MAG: DUF2225 domain-containing protein [Oscillospiraceae bacterium]|nr:DUF2225 domain-containing protein [Oscillospiraceae bacterium]